MPRRHGFTLTKSFRVPWYDLAVAHWVERGYTVPEAGLVMNHLDASTARNYAGKYIDFALNFCYARGLTPCPADADTVVKYLSWQAEKGTVAATSLPQYLSAIGCRHTDVGLCSPCTGSADPGVLDFCPLVSKALSGYAKGRKASIPADQLLDYKIYLPAHVASAALDLVLAEVSAFGSNPELLLLEPAKGLSGRVEASDWLWPADSCPDLLHAVAFWLRLRSLMRALPGACALMWRLPWEPAGFSTSRLRTVFANTLGSLNRCPPPGRKWSLHCIRAGPASECNALGIPLSRIRRQGGWGPKSDVPSKKYIDPSCPPSLDGRRFFDWLTPDGHLRRLGAA